MNNLNEFIEKISKDLQTLEKELEKEKIEKVEIKFPRGVFRRADEFRDSLSFIEDHTLKSNIAYTLMLTDLYRWILNRFDIGLVVQEMLIKQGISLIGHVIEAVLKNAVAEKNIGIDRCCTMLEKEGIITSELKKNIKWIWNMRCKEHLINLTSKEYEKYSIESYNKAIDVWEELEKALIISKSKL